MVALRRAADFLIRPQVHSFAFLNALRMGQSEFLTGATTAAKTVQHAMGAALDAPGDACASLDQLRHSGALAPGLHAALMDEVRRGQTEGDWARELQLAELAQQKSAVDSGHASLGRTLLVAGMMRHVAEEEMGGSLAAYHRMHLGSHLLVVAAQPDGLWRVDRQRELMRAYGCCVQVEVHFDDPTSSQTYLLEANVPGAVLAGEESNEASLSFLVADLNGMTGGAFWSSASRVTTFMDPSEDQ